MRNVLLLAVFMIGSIMFGIGYMNEIPLATWGGLGMILIALAIVVADCLHDIAKQVKEPHNFDI